MSEVSWTRERIGALLKVRYGKALPKEQRDDSAPFPVLGSAGRMTGTAEPLAFDPVIVIGRKGNVGQVQLETAGCWPIDTTYYAAIPQRLDARFLTWQLRSLELGKLDSSTATPSLRRQDLEAQEVLVPPLEEQRQIVAILEDHLSRLDAADRQLRAAAQRADVLLRAALSVGLRGGLVPDDLSDGSGDDLAPAVDESEPSADERWWSVPESWKWVRLGDVFEINVGATPPRGDQLAWKGDLPWVASGEVSFRRIETTREHIARAAAGNPQKRIHPPGTVLLAMIGEGKTRGQAAILDVEAAHNQNCASIRVSETEILPEYVYGYLEERYLETRRGGAGGQQPALNKAAIQTFLFPLAPLATQRALVSNWESLREERARLTSALDRAARHSAALRRGLLAAAFSGRLTESSAEMSVVEGRIGA